MFDTNIAFKLFATLLLSVCITILIPVILTALIPLVIYRRLLFYSAKYVNPRLGKMLTTRSSFLAADDFNTKPLVAEVFPLILEGSPTPSIDKIRNQFQDRVLNLKCLKTGKLCYPELRQTITRFMGYSFWKNVDDFKLEDYIYTLPAFEHRPIEDSEITQKLAYFTTKPFPKNRAMWELILIPEYIPTPGSMPKSNYFVILFRQHHALADGYSKIKFLQQLSLNPLTPAVRDERKQVPQISKFVKMLFYISLMIKLPYELADLIMNLSPNEVWDVERRSDGKPVKPHYSLMSDVTENIPLSLIKEIKDRHGVSFSAVVITATVYANELLMSPNLLRNQKDLMLAMPFPIGKHPEKLRNHL
jgi:hypothetical protein